MITVALRKTILGVVLGGALCSVAGAGCTVATEDTATDADGELARAAAVSRAEQWVGAKLHYCQAPNHQRDYDSACSMYCSRQNNKAWDPYRSDCSGLVSWAWKLPAPGRTTYGFAPYQTDITHAIQASSLQAGDAVNNSDHVMLFKKWTVKNKRAVFIEEPGCSSATPYAHEITSDVSISGSSIHVYYNGMSFTAIRFKGITNAQPKPEPVPPAPTASCDSITGGHGLAAGKGMASCDGRFHLDMQTDGNLVLYQKGHGAIWASNTYGRGYVMWMQKDGNAVVYSKTGNAVWASGTSGHSGAHLNVQSDGNVVVYDSGKALWSTKTGGR